MTNARILLADIETAYLTVKVWQSRLYNINISKDQIITDMHLLSYAAKWLGEKRIIYQDQSKARDMANDKPLVKSLWKLLDEADIVVVQNGRAFDLPTIRARMIKHQLSPPSPFRVIDTFLVAKKHFQFTKNSLEYLSEHLGCRVVKSKHKEFPGFELWDECLKRNPRAFAEMKRYNIDDVLSLEEVYLKMRPWIENHPNVGMYVDVDRPVCNKCGGRVIRRKINYTNAGIKAQYQCTVKGCLGYCTGKVELSSREKRRRQTTG